MNSLADLFTDDRRSNDDSGPVRDEAADERRLAELVGPPRVTQQTSTSPRDETARLVAMVDEAARSATPVHVAGKSGTPKLPRRGHKRTDWLNVSVGVLAVVIVAGVAVFGGIQLANASPAASALRSLSVDEASLANGEQAVRSGIERIDALVAEARADATAVEPGLAAVTGYVDEPARLAAVQAVADLRAGLDAVVAPSLPAPYARPAIDTEDLAEVGAQIDVVRERSDDLNALTDDVRTVRAQVVGLRDAFRGSINAFGATFPEAATAETTEYGQAETRFIDAVRAAAGAVPAAQAAGGLGVAEMTAYPPLVDALRVDHARAIAPIIAERGANRNTGGNTGGGSTNPGTGGGGNTGGDTGGDTGGGETTPTPEPTPTPDPTESTDPTDPTDQGGNPEDGGGGVQ